MQRQKRLSSQTKSTQRKDPRQKKVRVSSENGNDLRKKGPSSDVEEKEQEASLDLSEEEEESPKKGRGKEWDWYDNYLLIDEARKRDVKEKWEDVLRAMHAKHRLTHITTP
jgi:hypothetical protein